MKRFALLIPLLLACGPFFHQAPPSLAHYPQRIATKNWHEILNEAHPTNKTTLADLTSEIRTFTREISTLEKKSRLEKANAFITQNRQGQFSISVANFLLELRELIELDLPEAELESYLEWRSARLPAPSPPRPPSRDWRSTKEEHQKKLAAHNQNLLNFLDSHNARIASAPPNLKPFELIQRGGMFFRTGFLELAELDFLKVETEFPSHPRAEVASFMLGRVAFQSLGKLTQDSFNDHDEFRIQRTALTTKTENAFEKYLEKYPKGRFANDAFGWLGGLARDQGDPSLALNLQLRRLNLQPTREVTTAVLRECDQIFTDYFLTASDSLPHRPLLESPVWLPFDVEKLATHPLIVRLFVSHTLDPNSLSLFRSNQRNFSGDRDTLNFLHRRIIIPGPIATAALSQLGKAMVKRVSPHDATSLLVVGWASARQGDQNQALQLFELGLQNEITDELLHAKAVALSRLERNREAAIAFQALLTEFPNSPLSEPSRFELALALLHSGQAGQSFLIFHQLAQKWDNSDETFSHTSLHLANEHSQWIDTILQFSPLPELQKTFSTLPAEHPSAVLLRRAISMRALCNEDFTSAHQLVIPGELPKTSKRWLPGSFFDLSSARFERDLAPLIALHQKLTAPDLPPSKQARLHLEIGRHWKAKRGQLTLPLLDLTGSPHSEPDRRDQLLHDNARYLGLKEKAVKQALLSRDELTHAFRHFTRAAELSNDPEIAAPALEEANEALFRMAELSPYHATIAAQDQHTELSLQFVSRLREDFPNRPETARAHSFTFLPPILLGDWMPGDRRGWIADQKIAELFYSQQDDTEIQAARLTKQLGNMAAKSPTLSVIRAQLIEFDQQFQTLRPGLSPASLILLGGHLDDLQVVANHPGIPGDLFLEYLPIRLSETQPPRNPESPLAPFLDFLHRARDPNKIADWADYLETHPNGPKNEAASLRLLRREFRKSFPLPHVRPIFFPGAPRTKGYKHLNFPISAAHKSKASDLLKRHRQAYANGKYQADLSLLEAALNASARQYAAAIKILTGILNDQSHPELYQDAALQFSEISLRLLDLNERAALARTFKNNPAALAILTRLAHGGTCLSRLRPLIPTLKKN